MTRPRPIALTVTIFIHCGNDYLFLKRSAQKRIDPGKLNGVGGGVEPGEDYLSAAIREVSEETGYDVSKTIEFIGLGHIQEGYPEDYLVAFFKASVTSKKIPVGDETEDGKLIWIAKDKVLDSEYGKVDDLNYIFKQVTEDKTFFFNAQMSSPEKIDKISLTTLGPGS